MQVNWRRIRAAKNSFAALYAACEQSGYLMEAVDSPTGDVTCYSLNSVTARRYRGEMEDAGCIVIAGGPHPSACPEEVAAYADYVVTGEGEYTLPLLLDYIASGCRGPLPPGIYTKESSSPATGCVLLDSYPPFTKEKGYIEISRGCPHRCGYCQTPRLFGSGMRHRSIESIKKAAAVYEDIRFVTPNALAYGSDGITPALRKVELLLKSLPGKIFFGTFPSEVRPEFISEDSIALITSYCANDRLHFGAQSGSDSVLERLGRGHTVGDSVDAMELCREHGLMPVVDFILGLPNETEDDMHASMEFIREVVKDGKAHVHHFMPLPGTPLAGSEPVPVPREIQRDLGRLALAGKITGSWTGAELRFFRNRTD